MQHDAYLLTITSQTFKSFPYCYSLTVTPLRSTCKFQGTTDLACPVLFPPVLTIMPDTDLWKEQANCDLCLCFDTFSHLGFYLFCSETVSWVERRSHGGISILSFPLDVKKMIYKLMPHRKQLITVLTQLKKNNLRSLQKNTVHDATLARQMQRQMYSCRHCRFPSW